MAAISGAQIAQENKTENDYRYDSIGKNSEVFAVGDIVAYSSGLLLVGTAQAAGVSTKTVTMASTNQTVAKVTPGYVPLTAGTTLLMGTNADLTGNATDPGTFYSITGATGAQKVDVTKGALTSGNRAIAVEILKVDPFNEGGTGAGSGLRKALVRYVNIKESTFLSTF